MPVSNAQEEHRRYCKRFGQLAVEMGFISEEQLIVGLSEQARDDLANRPHRLLGTIFIEHGCMTPGQMDQVLNQMFRTEST
jgi:hypothetical protein